MPSFRADVRALVLALVLALGSSARVARAHGTIPSTNGIAFGAGSGGGLFGTNFGGLWQAEGGAPYLFVCETLVSGEPRSLDAWLWLGSGRIVAATTSGGFAFGVFAARDATGCEFAMVPGTEDLTVTEVIPDPDDATAFFASGRNDPATGEHPGRVVHGTPEAATVVFERAGYIATGVRARARHVYASIASQTVIGDSRLVHSADGGAHWDEWPETLTAGEAILPLGISVTDPLTLWMVHATNGGDILLRTTDGGAHFAPVLTVDARLAAFAQSDDGATVWVQSPTRSVYRSGDGGGTFEALAGSPHGACLAYRDSKLFACGVPWQDGMAWGVAADGKTFAPILVGFDDIAGPVACPARPAATEACREELDFVRGYYGFAAPPAPETEVAAEVSESGPDVNEPDGTHSEADATTESGQADTGTAASPSTAGGCTGAPTDGDAWTGIAALLAALGVSAPRRRRTAP